MRKIRNFFKTTQEIIFLSPEKEFSLYLKSFNESELGGIYRAIPWNDLIKRLKIKENTKEPDPIFTQQGMLALMFLKSYAGLSLMSIILKYISKAILPKKQQFPDKFRGTA